MGFAEIRVVASKSRTDRYGMLLQDHPDRRGRRVKKIGKQTAVIIQTPSPAYRAPFFFSYPLPVIAESLGWNRFREPKDHTGRALIRGARDSLTRAAFEAPSRGQPTLSALEFSEFLLHRGWVLELDAKLYEALPWIVTRLVGGMGSATPWTSLEFRPDSLSQDELTRSGLHHEEELLSTIYLIRPHAQYDLLADMVSSQPEHL